MNYFTRIYENDSRACRTGTEKVTEQEAADKRRTLKVQGDKPTNKQGRESPEEEEVPKKQRNEQGVSEKDGNDEGCKRQR